MLCYISRASYGSFCDERCRLQIGEDAFIDLLDRFRSD